jgi:hypothetical protein
MELVWILTGGDYDVHAGESKYYNLIEIDVLERYIKISNLTKEVYCIRPETDMDAALEKKIRDKITSGTSFLCKNEIYYNNKRYFNFGYYFINSEGHLEIKPIRDECKTIYNQFVYLLVDNCSYNY